MSAKINTRGKFIVFYGVNNLGKTTQAKRLVEKINTIGGKAEYLKYAIYNLKPSGELINAYLRQGNPYNLTPTDFQIIQALNKTQFEPTLEEKLNSGITIIAEDYTGTGLAWGIGHRVNPELMKIINSHLVREDLGILFNGNRFTEAEEANHAHETNAELTAKVALIHLQLAKELGWKIINANQTRITVEEEIWKIINPIL